MRETDNFFYFLPEKDHRKLIKRITKTAIEIATNAPGDYITLIYAGRPSDTNVPELLILRVPADDESAATDISTIAGTCKKPILAITGNNLREMKLHDLYDPDDTDPDCFNGCTAAGILKGMGIDEVFFVTLREEFQDLPSIAENLSIGENRGYVCQDVYKILTKSEKHEIRDYIRMELTKAIRRKFPGIEI